MQLLEEGRTYRAVAKTVHASLSSVVRWHQAYRKNGRDGLKSQPVPGRPSLLSAAQKRKLVQMLGKGSLSAGYPSEMWTLKRIGQMIRKQFGVRYRISSLWYLMLNLGWSCQKPTKRAKQRQEAEIRYWREHVWPHIKKGQRAWSPFGLPG